MSVAVVGVVVVVVVIVVVVVVVVVSKAGWLEPQDQGSSPWF